MDPFSMLTEYFDASGNRLTVSPTNRLPVDSGGGGSITMTRRDSDATSGSDGSTSPLYANSIGRLKVSDMPAAYDLVTGNITASAQNVSVDVSRASNIIVFATGTFTGVNLAFESSLDGTNWMSIQAVRTNANTIETSSGVIATGIAYGWKINVGGAASFRVRSTAWASGTALVAISRGAFATEVAPAIATHAVTGSGTFTVSGAVTTSGTVTSTPTISATTTGLLAFRNVAVVATAVAVKASSGRVHYFDIYNPNASPAYIQVYDLAAASVVVGTTTPAWTISLPAGSSRSDYLVNSLAFGTAISIAATTTPTGNTAPGTGIVANLAYV